MPVNDDSFGHRTRTQKHGDTPIFGAWLTVNSPSLLELLATSELGYVGIDCQHGMISERDAAAMLVRSAPAGAGRLVRVSRNDPAHIGVVLDAGADGVIVPTVNSAAEARAMVTAARFPPLGQRSFGPTASYLPHDPGQLDNRALVLPMIETAEGVGNLGEILAVDGVDGVYVGPADLGLALGHGSAQFPPTAELRQVMVDIAAAAAAAGKVAGAHAGSEHFAQIYRQLGFGMITLGTQSAFLTAGIADVWARVTTFSVSVTPAANGSPY